MILGAGRTAAGKFTQEIVPIEVPGRKGKAHIFKDEEIFRAGITYESMAKLKPVFNKDGTITAGNACALCDAAAAQVLMEREKAIALGHPVAATGSKILTTLLYAMKDRDAQLGLVSACIGGGNGVALVVERLN